MPWKTLNYAGLRALECGDFESAEQYLCEALKAAESVGRPHQRLAVSLNNLGEVYRRQGRLDEAEALYRRAIEIDELLLDRWRSKAPRSTTSDRLMLVRRHPAEDLASDLINLGLVYETRGDHSAAEELLERSDRLMEQAKKSRS